MASFAPIRGTRAQIQATPIVDGQFLVETDQGVDNKIYMDEGSTRTIVGGNTITGVLPELYIYSETGSVVTVEDAGGTSIPTSQVGTDHWICEVPDYGIYNIYSLLNGETTTQSINVDDCMIYTIDDSHFHCNVVVTYPSGVGATCTISGGGETYSAPALNPPDTSYKFVVHGKNTTYTITTNVDGAIKTETVTTGAVLDQTYNVTMSYARINLTVEAPPITGTLTCTDGTTTITRPVTPNVTLYVPDLGDWTISGSDGTQSYDVVVSVTSFSTIYNEDLSTAPDGKTVTPTDSVATWLLCAKIKNKSYTTLNEVLNDDETLQKLINSENACDYLVRSKTFMGEGLVPVLTGASSNVIYSSQSNTGTRAAFNAFDGDWNKSQVVTNSPEWYSTSSSNQWIGYNFTNPVSVSCFKIRGNEYYYQNVYFFELYNFKLQYSDDNSTWVDATELIQFADYKTHIIPVSRRCGAHQYWRVYCPTAYPTNTYVGLKNLQFYSTSILSDKNAMKYIGLRNYASNTLANDADWCEAITQLYDYRKYVLNTEVPKMTSNSAPSGSVVVSTEYNPPTYAGFKVFDKDQTTWWHSTAGTQSTPQYIGYDFDVDVVLKSVSYSPMYEGGNGGDTLTLVVEAYDPSAAGGTGDWIPLNTSDTYNDTNYHYIMISNDNAYSKYRLYITATTYHSGSNYYARLMELQFYCRADVDDTVRHVYSAANDTVSITGNGVSLTCVTDATGHGTIAKSSLPAGTYTFTSSVAKDPDNLDGSHYYSKQITISDGTIEAWVMPDGDVLYWYGYIGNNFEVCNSANGWSQSGYSFTDPTFNTNDIQLYAGSSVACSVGTKSAVSGNYKCIFQCIAGGNVGEFGNYPSKNLTGYTEVIRLTSTSITLYAFANPVNNGYPTVYTANGRTNKCYAFWGE